MANIINAYIFLPSLGIDQEDYATHILKIILVESIVVIVSYVLYMLIARPAIRVAKEPFMKYLIVYSSITLLLLIAVHYSMDNDLRTGFRGGVSIGSLLLLIGEFVFSVIGKFVGLVLSCIFIFILDDNRPDWTNKARKKISKRKENHDILDDGFID